VTEQWANQLKAKLFPTGAVKIRRRPTNQANVFLPYNWARIYPSSDSPTEFAYTVSIVADDGFVVEIDTVGLGESDPARLAYLSLRGESDNSSPITAILPAGGPHLWSKNVPKVAQVCGAQRS
jgi:5-methylcytosine-specific restriction protein B